MIATTDVQDARVGSSHLNMSERICRYLAVLKVDRQNIKYITNNLVEEYGKLGLQNE